MTDSKEFHIILEKFHKNLSEININKLVDILPFLSKMEISNQSQLIKDVISHLIKNINEISFNKSTKLYHYFTTEKIYKDFREKLKIIVESHILEKLKENEAVTAIHFASLGIFSVECNIKLLKTVLGKEKI